MNSAAPVALRFTLGLALGLAPLAGCGRDSRPPPLPDTSPSQPAPTDGADTLPEPDAPGDEDAAPSEETGADVVEARAALSPGDFRIHAAPDALMVYRSTPVRLQLRLATTSDRPDDAAPGELPEGLGCVWRLGDGTPEVEGCDIEHVFLGGSADARVGVRVQRLGESVELHRIIPLERLPVSGPRVTPDEDIPRAPDGPTSFRTVFISDTSGLGTEALTELAGIIASLGPHLVIHQGGIGSVDDDEELAGSEGWTAHRQGLAEPLRARQIPLVIVPSPGDLASGAEIRRPLDPDGGEGAPLDLAHAEGFPARYALSFRGVYFAIISGADLEAKDHGGEASLAWLRARLSEAQIYESRIVLSHLPLHAFSPDTSVGLIGPKFKLYELLHRGRATALVSAGHRVYFKGRYGALPVLSVGSASRSGRLIGHDHEQPRSITVMDVESGVPARIFALVARRGEPFAARFDESYLPETVEVYTR